MRKREKSQREIADILVREDFSSFLRRGFQIQNPGTEFLPNWHLDAMAARLEGVRRGEINRLIINLPPRYLKSLTVSIAFPAFLLGHNPALRIYALATATSSPPNMALTLGRLSSWIGTDVHFRKCAS